MLTVGYTHCDIRASVAMVRLPGVTGCFCSVLLHELESTQVLDLLLGKYRQAFFPMELINFPGDQAFASGSCYQITGLVVCVDVA